MGFTPWSWDATVPAVSWTYAQVHEDGDIVSHHIEQGVPWNESLAGTPFPATFQNTLQEMRSRTASTKKIVLQLNPLSGDRGHLAPYRNDTINSPLPLPWSGYALNDSNVKTAYLNYVKRVVDLIRPDFITSAIEANVLPVKAPGSAWAQFVDLQCATYKGLKEAGYLQPISVSFVTQALYRPDLHATEYDYAAQVRGLRDIEPCTDVIAWSVHPFISGLLAESFPDDYFTTIFALTSKPQAIAESSYPAQLWSMPSGSPTWNGTPEKQSHFVERMLSAARQHRLRHVIWFAVRDYDQLWNRPVAEGGLGQDTTGLIWRDTGLFDESGAPRSAHAVWRQWLDRPRK